MHLSMSRFHARLKSKRCCACLPWAHSSTRGEQCGLA